MIFKKSRVIWLRIYGMVVFFQKIFFLKLIFYMFLNYFNMVILKINFKNKKIILSYVIVMSSTT
jgi:hypothetical protein